MKFLDKLKRAVLKCDLFWSSDYFRYRSQTEYSTLTGGFCSFFIIILFVAVFSSSIVGTFNKSTLIWQYGLTQQTSNEFTITTNTDSPSKFMFAIGVNGLDLTSSSKYFDFSLSQQISINGQLSEINYTLAPCSRADWVGAGNSILEIYDRLNFSQYLCPPVNKEFSITGMLTSKTYKYLKISVTQCNNNSNLAAGSTCLPTSALETYLQTHSNFHFNVYFVNTLINPSSPNEISYYLEDRNFVPFNLNYGGQANIFVSKYSIVTDEEILPFNSVRTSEGGVVNNVGQYIASRKFGSLFANINFRKSSLSLNIERQYTKLDSTLSYIGGLFGFIIIFFVFMKIYTEYSYEIQMGDRLYYYDKRDPLNSDKFNFFTFIGYVFYELFKTLGCKLDWNLMKKYGECRQEIQKQFDICFLMKRLIFLQRSLRVLFEDHQFKGLHMHEKLTLKEAQEIRSFYKLRDKLQSICIEEIPDTEQMERNTKKSSDNSGIMNVTENVLQNNEELHEDSYNFNENYKKSDFPKKLAKRQKSSKSQFQMSQRNKSDLVNESEAIIKPLASGRPRQSNIDDGTPTNSNIQKKLKLLHKQSQSGNRISKMIYEGFDIEFIKNILIKIEQEKDQQKQSEKNEIIVNENEDEFQIRISKRLVMVKPRADSQIMKESEKNARKAQQVDEEEQVPNVEIKSRNSPRSPSKNKITNEFQYIQ